jgi:hypothetical protein
VYRIELHGHLVELRSGGWGGETLLLDGRPVSRKPMAGFYSASHGASLTDEHGRTRLVETRWLDASRGLGFRYRVLVLIDGAPRCILDPVDERARPGCCPHCGYALAGLAPDNGEVRCPECGRHSSALQLGFGSPG